MTEPTLPLPIAQMHRRARNAKSAKAKHDAAFYAWEASLRLAVAARPPADRRPLVKPSTGDWVSSLALPDRSLEAASLRACSFLFSHPDVRPPEGGGAPPIGPRAVTPRSLFPHFGQYRNDVVGHASVRDAGFYAWAGDLLLDGLEDAWSAQLFWPAGARLFYVESIELDPDGERRARILDLSQEGGRIVDPRGTPEPSGDLRPRRLYLRDGKAHTSLHPWLLFLESDLRESVLMFNGLGRGPRFLDYASGRIWRRPALVAHFPDLDDEVAALFSGVEEPPATDAPTPPGDDGPRFGGFEIRSKLGAGGMGEVFLAEQKSLERLVALKVLTDELARDRVAVVRFEQEISALSRCEHPNVVKILDSGVEDGHHYYAMEFVDGADLAQLADTLSTAPDFDSAVSSLADATPPRGESGDGAIPAGGDPPGRTTIKKLAALFAEAARGVHHLHERGIIHRDLKPANVMFTFDRPRAVVMDLGLAKIRESTRSITQDASKIIGTLRYVPPEQLQRNLLQIDHRVDVYALGATFYELLTGHPIFAAENDAQLVEKILLASPLDPRKVNPAIPNDLATILLTATEKDPRMRYADAAALAEDVEAWIDQRPIRARPPSLSYVLRLAIERHRALASTVLVSAVGLLALLVLYAKSRGDLAVTEQRRREGAEFRLDVATARTLVTEMETPAALSPTSAPRLRRWIETIERLRARRADYHANYGLDESEAVEAFARDLDTLVGERLAPAGADLALVSGLRARSLEKAAARWQRAIADIAASDRYPGLGEMRPQLGLVPLRKDGASGLWEFCHVASGAEPSIDAKTGRYVIGRETGIVLVLLPGGTFRMGSPEAERYRDEGEKLTQHELEPFWVAKYEVTQAQWERALGSNPSYYGPGVKKDGKVVTAVNPVENVSWYDALELARRLVLRLPSSAEWEYACRGGSTAAYVWSGHPRCLAKRENLKDRSLENSQVPGPFSPWNDGHQIHAPVGSFAPNPFGLYDVLGNVNEWTADTLDGDATTTAGRRRVICRGGSWHLHGGYARAAMFLWDKPNSVDSNRGVRLVRSLKR